MKKGWQLGFLYRNTLWCIVTKRSIRLECIARQVHDTASQARGTMPATRSWGACDTELGRLRHGHQRLRHDWGPRPQHGRSAHDTAMRSPAWARLCAPGCAGWVRWLCTLCTCSVFGLSTVSESLVMNTVHKIFSKNKIK